MSPLVLESGIQVAPPSREYSRAMVWATPLTPLKLKVTSAELKLGVTPGLEISVPIAPKESDMGETAPSSVIRRTLTLSWFPGKTADVSQVSV